MSSNRRDQPALFSFTKNTTLLSCAKNWFLHITNNCTC